MLIVWRCLIPRSESLEKLQTDKQTQTRVYHASMTSRAKNVSGDCEEARFHLLRGRSTGINPTQPVTALALSSPLWAAHPEGKVGLALRVFEGYFVIDLSQVPKSTSGEFETVILGLQYAVGSRWIVQMLKPLLPNTRRSLSQWRRLLTDAQAVMGRLDLADVNQPRFKVAFSSSQTTILTGVMQQWRSHGGARVDTCPTLPRPGRVVRFAQIRRVCWRSGWGSRLRMSLKVHHISSLNRSRKCVCPLQIVYAYLASGGFAPDPPPGLCPWTPLGDFRPLYPPYLQTLVTPLSCSTG